MPPYQLDLPDQTSAPSAFHFSFSHVLLLFHRGKWIKTHTHEHTRTHTHRLHYDYVGTNEAGNSTEEKREEMLRKRRVFSICLFSLLSLPCCSGADEGVLSACDSHCVFWTPNKPCAAPSTPRDQGLRSGLSLLVSSCVLCVVRMCVGLSPSLVDCCMYVSLSLISYLWCLAF